MNSKKNIVIRETSNGITKFYLWGLSKLSNRLASLAQKIGFNKWHIDRLRQKKCCYNTFRWDTPIIQTGNLNLGSYGTPLYFSNEVMRGRRVNSDIVNGTIFTAETQCNMFITGKIIITTTYTTPPNSFIEYFLSIYKNGIGECTLGKDHNTEYWNGSAHIQVYEADMGASVPVSMKDIGDNIDLRLKYDGGSPISVSDITISGYFAGHIIDHETEIINNPESIL